MRDQAHQPVRLRRRRDAPSTRTAAPTSAIRAQRTAASSGSTGRIDLATATALTETFLEAVVCPGVDDDAAAHLATKPRIRVLVVDRPSGAEPLDVRSIDGGLLVQTRDRVITDRSTMTVASAASA